MKNQQQISKKKKKIKTKNIKKKSQKKLSPVQPINLRKDINNHFKVIDQNISNKIELNENNQLNDSLRDDKFFCDSLSECSSRLLRMIGYYSLTDSVKEVIDRSINNLSYLLKLSFMESLKFCVTVFGVISFSVPGLEHIYQYTKDKSNQVYNYLPSVSGLGNKLLNKITNIQDINPKDIFIRLKNIIVNHKILISISTVLLVIISLKVCSVIKNSNTSKNNQTNIHFNNILIKYLNFYPFTTEIGKIIIEYTGLFMDSAQDIVKKIISQISIICQYRSSSKLLLSTFETHNQKFYIDQADKTYLKHQLIPIKYLTINCVNKDGLFLFHSTGSGKTLTALGIAQNLGLSTIIGCPDFLINQWKNDYLNRYKITLPKTEIYSLQKLYNHLKDRDDIWFQRHTLILDEVHNLVYFNNTQKINLLNLLFKFRKRIILTATPIFKDIFDIAIPINLTRGQFIFPTDKVEFRKQFFKVKQDKSFYLGWVLPILHNIKNFNSFIETYQIGTINNIMLTYGDQNQLDLIKISNIIIKNVLKYTTYAGFFKYILSFSNLSDSLSRKIYSLGKFYKISLPENFTFMFKLLLDHNDPDKENIKQINSLFKQSSSIIQEKHVKLAKGVIETLFLQSTFHLLFTLFVFIFEVGIKHFYSDAHLNNGIEEYFIPDFNLIGHNLGSYISYYNYQEDSSNYNLFPKVIKKNIAVLLNDFQIACLYRYVFNKMGQKEYSQLGIIDNTTEFNLINFDQTNKELFYQYGSYVGNISLIEKRSYYRKKKEDNQFIYPFSNILELLNDQTYNLRPEYQFKSVSNKFIKINEIINNFKNKKIVIYSNNSKSIKLLSAYLNEMHNSHLFLANKPKSSVSKSLNNNNESQEVEDSEIENTDDNNSSEILEKYYKNKKTSILLLDSQYYEGISILKTNVFIILESNRDLSKTTQLLGRCVRLNSHLKGEKIEIINLTSKIDWITKYQEKLKFWSQEHKHAIFDQFKTIHLDIQTPDEINYQYIQKLNNETNQLIKQITQKSIEKIDNNESQNCQKIDCELKTIDQETECGIINKDILENK